VAHPEYRGDVEIATGNGGGGGGVRPVERLNADVEANAIREQQAAVAFSQANGDKVRINTISMCMYK
jgi:hypothetical protein